MNNDINVTNARDDKRKHLNGRKWYLQETHSIACSMVLELSSSSKINSFAKNFFPALSKDPVLYSLLLIFQPVILKRN